MARAAFDPDENSYTFKGYERDGHAVSNDASRGIELEDVRSTLSNASETHDRREAEALLAALRRGKSFGLLRDPVEMLEEKHFAVCTWACGWSCSFSFPSFLFTELWLCYLSLFFFTLAL